MHDLPEQSKSGRGSPAPGNGSADADIAAVRLALMSISRDRPGGQVLSVEELRDRVRAIESVDYHRRGVALPALIRDLNTPIAAGRDVAVLLELAVMVYAQTVRGWLLVLGAPLDLRWQVSTMVRQAAQELDDPTALAVVEWRRWPSNRLLRWALCCARPRSGRLRFMSWTSLGVFWVWSATDRDRLFDEMRHGLRAMWGEPGCMCRRIRAQCPLPADSVDAYRVHRQCTVGLDM
ncbi:MAG: hypothetical protein ACRDUV_14535 [Pseudonocardiaceae bacterium]